MFIDADLCLVAVSDNVMTPQAETTVDTHVSDNVIDLTRKPQSIIESMYFVFECAVVPISGGGGTLQIDLVTSAAVGLTTPTIMWSSGVIPNATMVAWSANSSIYAFKIPAHFALRYLGCNYTIVTAVLTAGSWRAFFAVESPHFIAPTP